MSGIFPLEILFLISSFLKKLEDVNRLSQTCKALLPKFMNAVKKRSKKIEIPLGFHTKFCNCVVPSLDPKFDVNKGRWKFPYWGEFYFQKGRLSLCLA